MWFLETKERMFYTLQTILLLQYSQGSRPPRIFGAAWAIPDVISAAIPDTVSDSSR
jgi:hypothetical protein